MIIKVRERRGGEAAKRRNDAGAGEAAGTRGDGKAKRREGVFGDLIVGYLFLAGAGAGTCFFLSVLGLLVPASELKPPRPKLSEVRAFSRIESNFTYRDFFAPAFGWCLVALFLGVVCLMADLGRVDRLLLLLLNPTASYISVGTYGLIAVAIFALLLFAFWMGSIRRLRVWMLKLLCIAAAAASVVVMLYAGLLLSTMPSVPLWNTPWVPALFVLSALSCGSACLLASSAATGQGLVFGRTLRGVVVCDVVVIVLEFLALAGFALSCAGLLTEPANATELAGAASAERLLLGDLAPLMWAGFVVCGLLAPLVLESAALRRWAASPPLMLAVSALVLVGACIMRYCIVQAGMQPSLL